MQIIGIDIGFGFTKATDGQDTVVFKSIYGEAAEIAYRDQLTGDARNDVHLHLVVDGKPVFVGELAERQSNVRSFTLDQDQFVTGFARLMAFGALSRLAERNEPVSLVTGLPVAYFQRHREQLAELLRGKHELRVLNAAGTAEETVLAVNQVRVVPQPYGSLFDVLFSDTGEIGAPHLAREKVGVIDVGFRTADYTIADKTRFSARGSATTEAGMSRAFAMIATRLKDMTGVDVEIYRLYDAMLQGGIKIRGKQIDLREMREEVYTQLASTIATEAERLWHDDWDMDRILITGGGGKTLAPYLQGRIEGEVESVDQTRDARQNNARGYWKYGRHLWARSPARPKAAEA